MSIVFNLLVFYKLAIWSFHSGLKLIEISNTHEVSPLLCSPGAHGELSVFVTNIMPSYSPAREHSPCFKRWFPLPATVMKMKRLYPLAQMLAHVWSSTNNELHQSVMDFEYWTCGSVWGQWKGKNIVESSVYTFVAVKLSVKPAAAAKVGCIMPVTASPWMVLFMNQVLCNYVS